MMEIYYEFEKKFEEKINSLMDNEQNEEMLAVSKIIKEIMKGGVNDNKRNIRRRSEKARKIYRIISVVGGKEKIKRLKVLNLEDYTKFSFREIEEWIKNCQKSETKIVRKKNLGSIYKCLGNTNF